MRFLGKWEWADPIAALPDLCGVYAIYDGISGNLQYIGSAVNLRNRLTRAHLKRKLIARPRVKFCICRPGDHLAREFRLIARLKPLLNQMGIAGRQTSEYLPTMLGEMRRHQDDAIRTLGINVPAGEALRMEARQFNGG